MIPTFAAQCKAWREYFGLTKPQLALRVGVTTECVIMWESGATKRPSDENLRKLVEALGITLAQFWGPVPSRPHTDRTEAA